MKSCIAAILCVPTLTVALSLGASMPGDDDAPETGDRTMHRRTLRGASDATHLPGIYVVLMKGQMGTDVNRQVYEDVKADILEHQPDLIVIRMDCKDNEDRLYSDMSKFEEGLAEFDEYRELVNLFRDDLRDFRQVMWVHDSVGFSSPIALAWDELYMGPTARLGNMRVAFDKTNADRSSDDDFRGKMSAAVMSWVKGFLEYGGYDLKLADAMIIKEHKLSATWRGRDVIWSLNDSGEYPVDSSDENTAQFRAKTAEDFGISKGTAETLDDLALILGYREFRVIEGRGEEIVESYIEDWRRLFDQTKTWFDDYQQHLGWAGGEDTIKWLGRAKSDLQRIVNAMNRYKAVEIRWQMERGLNKFWFETEIEKLKERIRGIQQGRRAGGGGSGRGGGGRGIR
jgi:hypothetical protein